jgi:hypothetical protein
MNSGHVCCYWAQNMFFSSLLFKNMNIKICTSITSCFYGRVISFLTLREEHRPRLFESRVLRKIFGAKRDEVGGEWRRLHNEQLQDLHSSRNNIRAIK